MISANIRFSLLNSISMNISIPYPEIQDIIRAKKGIELNISYLEHNVLGIGIRLPIVGLVTLNVKYLDFDGHHIRLQLVNNVLNMIVVKLVGMVNKLIGKDILYKEGNDILKVSLDQFPKVINALQKVDVQSIEFNSTSVDVCFFLK